MDDNDRRSEQREPGTASARPESVRPSGNNDTVRANGHTGVKVSALLQLVHRDYIENAKKSHRTVASHTERHLKPFFGALDAECVTTEHVERYRHKRTVEGAARATINLELATLRRGYKLALMRTPPMVSRAPYMPFYNVGKSNRRTGYFEESDYRAMLLALPLYAKQLLRFAYYCGWREGELFSLTWIDTKSGKASYDGRSVTLWDSKSGDGRTFPLDSIPDVRAVIDEQYAARVSGCPWIFHRDGERCNRSTFNGHWRAACKKAKVNRYFHDLRRTAVRNLLRAGVHATVAMMITGHKTDEILRRYDIVSLRDHEEALEKLSTYLDRRSATATGRVALDKGFRSDLSTDPESGFVPIKTDAQSIAIQSVTHMESAPLRRVVHGLIDRASRALGVLDRLFGGRRG